MKVTYLVYVLMIFMLYSNWTVMGADHELESLNQIRNSSGQLIKYEQAN